MAVEINQLSIDPITAHACNGERTQSAVCENSNQVKIYEKSEAKPGPGNTTSSWTSIHTLSDVTPSKPATWQPTSVLSRLNRSATFVRWSPDEAKFEVGSGARAIAVRQYDDEANWWVAKHLKKPLRSTVPIRSVVISRLLLADGYTIGPDTAPHGILVIKLPSLPLISLGKSSNPNQSQRQSAGGIGRLNNEAFNLSRSADSRGVMSQVEGAVTSGNRAGVDTVHSNTISSIRNFFGQDGQVSHLSTSGVDGKLVIWDSNAGSDAGISHAISSLSV
ncbi:hypothetical protein PSHT_02497 [Puccinia striiformis]|uniref:Actin-related protein 2/3 complex subunit n=1 Tax=Puccinia striiformis TaxID=27350 RepID=A0A2S4WI20_9BASI|nr:hypothetical protein PSHT_02497 [Puccinia striiformis]